MTRRHLLLVHGSLGLGGVETLILRMCRYFRRETEWRVSVLLLSREADSALAGELASLATLHYLSWPTRLTLAGLDATVLSDVDYIYALNGPSLLTALAVQGRMAPSARVIAGVYHPLEYCPATWLVRYQHALARRIFRRLPRKNAVFMNEACRRRHARALGADFSTCPIVPLAVTVPLGDARPRLVKRGKIVSVGRIVRFKRYAFSMVDVVRDLAGRYPMLEYHVFGDGPELPALRQRIADAKLHDRVFLHGPVPYAEFRAAVTDAMAFVGMGTAAVEAAATGVPTLLGIEAEEEPLTYGFLSEAEGYLVGERDDEIARVSYHEKIIELMDMAADDYAAVSLQCATQAREFDLERVMPRFIAALEGSEPYTFPIRRQHVLLNSLDGWSWYLLAKTGVPDIASSQYDERPGRGRPSVTRTVHSR